MKFKSWLLVAGVVLGLGLQAPTANAITAGEPDKGKHPWVGALVSYDPETSEKYLICSGTLIAPRVFMTAAHCLLDEPSDLYVSFEEFVGAPDVGPDVKLYHGDAISHPEFEDETAPGDTNDIAVVVLDERVKGVKPAHLPKVGTLDRLVRHDVAEKLQYGVVGYGREGKDEEGFFGGGGRRYAFSSFSSLESHKLHLSQLVSEGDGGTCRGDSGGPAFLGKTRVVVGITSDGDPDCAENGVYYRVDTKSARAFLRPIIKQSRRGNNSHDDDDQEDDG